jgi:hypothetical protein
MLQVLHILNLSYIRPTNTFVKADKGKQEVFILEFEFLNKFDYRNINHILFEDELMIRVIKILVKVGFPKANKELY